MRSSRVMRGALAALGLGMFTISTLAGAAPAYAGPTATSSGEVGVVVDPTTPPPTEAPTTTPPTTTPTTMAPTTTTPPTSTVPTTQVQAQPPVTAPVESTTDESLVQELQNPTPSSDSKGFVAQVKSAGTTTKKLVSGVLSGKPVADVAQAVLPAPVADVVVPAVRTASTFAFPIGLAGAVLGFLALQQRVDAGDPKLAAAPIAHDDDVVTFS